MSNAPIDRASEVTYYATGGFRDEGSVMVRDGDASLNLPHVIKHSPTGFAWGYGGSGPAETARCILIHFFGEEVRCRNCDGSGRVRNFGDEVEAYCPDCAGEGYRLPVNYQDFKFNVIAKLPQNEPWRLTGLQIVEWMRTTPAGVTYLQGFGVPSQQELDEEERAKEEEAL